MEVGNRYSVVCDSANGKCSHYHFDHTGDPSTLPASVKLVVGPGFKQKCLPGYPSDPKSPVLESDYAYVTRFNEREFTYELCSGRELEEISFQDSIKIGAFRAHDFFGDRSFYLLDVPGHAVGKSHIELLTGHEWQLISCFARTHVRSCTHDVRHFRSSWRRC